MKRTLCALVALLTIAGSATAQQKTVVTPADTNGWSFKTFGPRGKTTADWYVGNWTGSDRQTPSALWLYSGQGDGISYAETKQFSGTRAYDLKNVGYSTFTAEGIGNVCALLAVGLDTNGDGKGDAWVLYDPPADRKNVRPGSWSAWSVMDGKLWCNKYGADVLKTFHDWVEFYGGYSVRVDAIRVQAGTWDPAVTRYWNNRWLAVDGVSVDTGSGDRQFDFEPAPPFPGLEPAKEVLSLMTAQGQGQSTMRDKPKAQTAVPVVGETPKTVAPPKTTFAISDPRYFVYKDALQGSPEKIDQPWERDGYAYVPVLFDGNHNMRVFLSTNTARDFGTPNDIDRDPAFTNGGSFMLGGVPFHFGYEPKNIWNAYECPGTGEHKLTLKVNLPGAVEVHTLINTLNGVPLEGLVKIEFIGEGGAYHKVDLAGDRDFRDWHEGPFTNRLKERATQVWWKAKARLDKQVYALPKEFEAQKLTQIIITDKGMRGQQTLVMFGMTVKVKADQLK